MSSRVRTFGRWLGAAAVVAILGIAAAWFALPPAIDARDGPADPLLRLRRPVLHALHHLGLVTRSLVGPDDWLPSGGSTDSWGGEPAGTTFATAAAATRTTMRSEPVYRGAFWRVGWRVSLALERKGPEADPPNSVVLWCETDGRRTDVARGGPHTLDPATGVRRHEVSGFVSTDADRFGWSEVKQGGRPREIGSWSR